MSRFEGSLRGQLGRVVGEPKKISMCRDPTSKIK